MIGGDLSACLRMITNAAPVFQDDWFLIGSAAAHVAGADVGVISDIDLLLTERDITALDQHWRERKRLPPGESDQFQSKIFHRFEAPLPIEAMAGFELKTPADEWLSIWPNTRVQFGQVFAPSITEQIEIMALMNRDKDRNRITALKSLL